MDLGDLARRIVEENLHCVLATSSLEGKPEAATIQYASEGFSLYFETMKTYRKYANLIANPLASVVINQLPNTLQMDGTVKLLNIKDEQHARKLLSEKLGMIPRFYDSPDIKFFKFTPTWIRAQSEGWPPKYTEIKP